MTRDKRQGDRHKLPQSRVRLDPELKEKFLKLCELRGENFSEGIIRLIKDELNRNRNKGKGE